MRTSDLEDFKLPEVFLEDFKLPMLVRRVMKFGLFFRDSERVFSNFREEMPEVASIDLDVSILLDLPKLAIRIMATPLPKKNKTLKNPKEL